MTAPQSGEPTIKSWLIIASLLLLQDSAPVPGLVLKIDGRDPVESFRAIDALADLGPDRRSEVEKAASALPEFYRDALLAELKTPAPLARITLGGTKRPGQHLAEIAKQMGIRLQNGDEVGGDPIEFTLEGVHALDAFARACSQGELGLRQDPRDASFIVGRRSSRSAVFGHRSAAVILNDSWINRRVDFTVAKPWRLSLSFETVLGPGVRSVRWDKIRIYKATMNGGLPISAARPDAPSILEGSIIGGTSINRWSPKLIIDLGFPVEATGLEELQFSATGLVATKERILEIPGSAGRVTREGLEIEVGPIERTSSIQSIVNLRIRAREATLKPLLQALFAAELVYRNTAGYSSIVGMREIDGGVSCTLEWMVQNQDGARVETTAPKASPDRIRLHLPDGVQERTVFAEFRNIN